MEENNSGETESLYSRHSAPFPLPEHPRWLLKILVFLTYRISPDSNLQAVKQNRVNLQLTFEIAYSLLSFKDNPSELLYRYSMSHRSDAPFPDLRKKKDEIYSFLVRSE